MPWGQLQAGIQLNDFKKRMYDAALAGIKLHAPDAKTILDVGCSFGGFLLEARKLGYEGAGVDIVPEAVDYVKQQGFAAEACESNDSMPADIRTESSRCADRSGRTYLLAQPTRRTCCGVAINQARWLAGHARHYEVAFCFDRSGNAADRAWIQPEVHSSFGD